MLQLHLINFIFKVNYSNYARSQHADKISYQSLPRLFSFSLLHWTCSTFTDNCSSSKRKLRNHFNFSFKYYYYLKLLIKSAFNVIYFFKIDTTSYLLTQRWKDQSPDGFVRWPFTSVHFWGENPKGLWTVNINDRVN